VKITWIIYKRFDSDLSRTSREEMTRALAKQGHDVTLVTAYAGDKPTCDLGPHVRFVRTLPWKGFYSLWYSVMLFFYVGFKLATARPDVVLFEHYAFLPLFPFLVLKKLRLLSTSFVLDIRTVPVDVQTSMDRLKERLYEMSVVWAKYLTDGVTVITPLLKEQIVRATRIAADRVGIWNSGVTTDVFDPKAPSLEKKTLFADAELTLMYHGTLSPFRGLQQTLEALALLRDRGRRVALFIMGCGAAYDELRRMIDSLSLHDRVTLHPPVPYKQVPAFIAGCDAGILPFPSMNWWQVSSPLKLMEYLSMAKPVLVTDIQAHREVLADLPCGLFVQTATPDAIVAAIEQAITMRAELPHCGEVGRQRILERYSWDVQARYLTDFCNALAERRRP
jgi:glycosyltransferase involved in cell wall biosynthesis